MAGGARGGTFISEYMPIFPRVSSADMIPTESAIAIDMINGFAFFHIISYPLCRDATLYAREKSVISKCAREEPKLSEIFLFFY